MTEGLKEGRGDEREQGKERTEEGREGNEVCGLSKEQGNKDAMDK